MPEEHFIVLLDTEVNLHARTQTLAYTYTNASVHLHTPMKKHVAIKDTLKKMIKEYYARGERER